jgi:hypothetical protein
VRAVPGWIDPNESHPPVHHTCVLPGTKMTASLAAAGNSQTLAASRLLSIQAAIERRVCSVTLNCTWRPVTRPRTPEPVTRSETFNATRSQPLSLLSRAKSNSARSRV